MNYMESKNKLDKIRQNYSCKGDVIFRTAIQYIVDYGRASFQETEWFDFQMKAIDERHDKIEAEGKIYIISREFEKAILECAKEMSEIEAYDFLTYIQREIWLGGNGIDYQRAIELCKNAIDWMVADTYETSAALEEIREMGFDDDEIDELGFSWMLDADVEDEE